MERKHYRYNGFLGCGISIRHDKSIKSEGLEQCRESRNARDSSLARDADYRLLLAAGCWLSCWLLTAGWFGHLRARYYGILVAWLESPDM